jgi:ribosome-associated protein
VRAIYDELHVKLKALGEKHRPVEGADLGWWIVMDYGNVVVHVLQDEARSFYDLEHLYGDCPEVDWRELEQAPERMAE